MKELKEQERRSKIKERKKEEEGDKGVDPISSK